LILFFFLICYYHLNDAGYKLSSILLSPQYLEIKKSTYQNKYTAFELNILKNSFVDLKMFIPGIKVDLKYATSDNFIGIVLYDSITHAFLHEDAAMKLKNAQTQLKLHNNSFSFIVYDALRPQQVQFKMWEIVKNTPKERYVANPNKGSMHNYGCAVDLSIIRDDSILLDMGSPFDFLEELSQFRYNEQFILEKKLTKQQVANRILLRNIMEKAGFYPINSEWWHFNAFKNNYVRQHYKIVK